MHVSFALDRAPTAAELNALYGDQTLPRLPTGGLLRWISARSELHHLLHGMPTAHHFLYASSGMSIGQWLVAHGAGGRLVAGAVRISDIDDPLGRLYQGEVIELSLSNPSDALTMIARLQSDLRAAHLTAVPVGRLVRDAAV
jgi:hypothetical protein